MNKYEDDSETCDLIVANIIDNASDKAESLKEELNMEAISMNSYSDHEDTRSVGTQESASSRKIDKSVNVDLSHAGISNIEELLESLKE